MEVLESYLESFKAGNGKQFRYHFSLLESYLESFKVETACWKRWRNWQLESYLESFKAISDSKISIRETS